jgi:hypothetical protein
MEEDYDINDIMEEFKSIARTLLGNIVTINPELEENVLEREFSSMDQTLREEIEEEDEEQGPPSREPSRSMVQVPAPPVDLMTDGPVGPSPTEELASAGVFSSPLTSLAGGAFKYIKLDGKKINDINGLNKYIRESLNNTNEKFNRDKFIDDLVILQNKAKTHINYLNTKIDNDTSFYVNPIAFIQQLLPKEIDNFFDNTPQKKNYSYEELIIHYIEHFNSTHFPRSNPGFVKWNQVQHNIDGGFSINATELIKRALFQEQDEVEDEISFDDMEVCNIGKRDHVFRENGILKVNINSVNKSVKELHGSQYNDQNCHGLFDGLNKVECNNLLFSCFQGPDVYQVEPCVNKILLSKTLPSKPSEILNINPKLAYKI